jgi:two-component system, OmpR family, alkaline phosphatase synthesis response regulator PhoP
MNKIILIEDDQLLQRMYLKKLKLEGFEVIQAYNGSEGLDLIHKQKPDLILLDVMLPQGQNGFDVLENLKRDEDTKSIPVIMLTNLDSEQNVAERIGAAEYIVKADASLDEVVEKIKKLL